MVELAKRPPAQYVPLKELAEQQDISEKYLEAIVRKLVAAGMLDGQRGRGGGYRLKRPAEDYSAGEILSIMEKTLMPVACMNEGAAPCERMRECETLPLWRDFHALMQDFFSGVSIADLARGGTGSRPGTFRCLAEFEDGAGI